MRPATLFDHLVGDRGGAHLPLVVSRVLPRCVLSQLKIPLEAIGPLRPYELRHPSIKDTWGAERRLSIYLGDATLVSAPMARWSSGRRSRRREAYPKCARTCRSRGLGWAAQNAMTAARSRRQAGREITPGPLCSYGSPAGDLNARSRVGIGRGACSNRLDRGPGRVAGSGLVPNAQWLGR